MDIRNLKLSVQTAGAVAIGLVAASGAWYTLLAKVEANEHEIRRVEVRNVADSNRIRRIENRGAAAKAEREGIREQIRGLQLQVQVLQEQVTDNGRKLDALIIQIQRARDAGWRPEGETRPAPVPASASGGAAVPDVAAQK